MSEMPDPTLLPFSEGRLSGPPALDVFYDARRGVHYTKPALRGWLHLLWFGASLVLGTLLLARAHGAAKVTAAAIYAASAFRPAEPPTSQWRRPW